MDEVWHSASGLESKAGDKSCRFVDDKGIVKSGMMINRRLEATIETRFSISVGFRLFLVVLLLSSILDVGFARAKCILKSRQNIVFASYLTGQMSLYRENVFDMILTRQR